MEGTSDRRNTGDRVTARPGTGAYLVCASAGGLWGIEVGRVRHINVVGRIWRPPGLPEYVKGVTRIRNRLLPLIDLRLRLGLPPTTYHARTCVVAVDTSVPAALAVDSVEGVSHFTSDQIVPPAQFGGGAESPAVAGIVTHNDRPCMLLHVEWLVLGESPTLYGAADTASESHGGASASESVPPSATADGAACCADTPRSPVSLSVIGVLKTSNAAREERLIDLLAKPVVVGTRRTPGFRPGDPRLPALAIALLQMPATFRTRDAAPVVAGLLGRPTHDYRLNQFRYDLGKLRARGLAERIGTTRRYCLTRIGRIVCRVLEKGRVVKDLIESRARNVAHGTPLVRSA